MLKIQKLGEKKNYKMHILSTHNDGNDRSGEIVNNERNNFNVTELPAFTANELKMPKTQTENRHGKYCNSRGRCLKIK